MESLKDTNSIKEKKIKTILKVLFIILIFVRLWLLMTMNWRIEMDSFYDSRLEMGSALSLAGGGWMGQSYSKFVLCKGVSFPLFVAFSFLTRIPYPVCLFMLIVFAASLFVGAVKPFIAKDWIRKIIFIFLIYNPVGLGGEMAYPYRNALAPWLVLIIISCILAIYIRRNSAIKKLLPWAAVLLLSTGFFWNLREDSMWFLPFIIVGPAVMFIHFILENKEKARNRIGFLIIALCPLISVFAWNTGISVMNNIKYGIYTTEDRTKTYEAKVLGKLIQIDDGADLNSDYWVSEKAIELAKEVSPSFNSLNLEPFSQWPRIGDYSIWALRDSMESSGFYIDARTTNDMYKKIYDELDEAFREGRLNRKNGIQLSDTSGLYSVSEMINPIGIAFKSLVNHVVYNEYEVNPEVVDHVKSEGDIVFYENMLNINLRRTDEQLFEIGADRKTIQSNTALKMLLKVNRHISNLIIKCYNVISWILFIASIAGFSWSIWLLFRRGKGAAYSLELVLFQIGLLLLVLLNAYLVGLWGTGFELTADSGLFKAYTTPQTILISCIEIIGTYLLVKNALNMLKYKK